MHKHGIKIFDVKKVATQGGSIRVYATHNSNRKYRASKRLFKMLASERNAGLNAYSGLMVFADKVAKHNKAYFPRKSFKKHSFSLF